MQALRLVFGNVQRVRDHGSEAAVNVHDELPQLDEVLDLCSGIFSLALLSGGLCTLQD